MPYLHRVLRYTVIMYRSRPYTVVPCFRHSSFNAAISSTLIRHEAVRMCSRSHLVWRVRSIRYARPAVSAASWAFALQVS